MINTVLITGVAGGIGAATSFAFAEAGWRVFGTDCRQPLSLTHLDLFVKANLGDPGDYERLFAEIAGKTGHLDALINNAALQICKSIVDTTLEEWDMVMAVNLRSVFLSIRHAHPLLSVRGGAVVNIGSVHSISTSGNIAAYAASKGGLAALTRAAALELGPSIRVNAVLPGAVDTPMLIDGLKRAYSSPGTTSDRMEQLARKTALQRIATPEEIAQAILFLADSKRSSFITGQSIVVDGGATARLSTE